MPETSQLICTENQLTDFYMRATLAFNGLLLEVKFGSRTIIMLIKLIRLILTAKKTPKKPCLSVKKKITHEHVQTIELFKVIYFIFLKFRHHCSTADCKCCPSILNHYQVAFKNRKYLFWSTLSST